jgi:polysaccharide biosynthesis protein VpsM
VRDVFDNRYLRPATAFVFLAWTCACPAGETTEPPEPARPAEFARPLREGIPSLQLSTDLGAPALGLGTYRPVGQAESHGVHLGPFTARAAMQAGVGYDDNVALQRSNKISSMIYTWSPSIAVGLEGNLARYYVLYRGNYGRYSSSSVDNYEEHDFLLSAANSWTTRFRSLLMYEYLRGHNPRGAIVGSTASERWVLQTLRASGSYGAEGAPGRLEGEAAVNRLRYPDQPIAAPREYDSVELGGTFFYRLAPKTRALLQVRRADITHDAARTLDSVETGYFVGLTWDALATLQGSVKVGYMTKDFSDAARDDFSAPSYEAVVLWSPLTYSNVELFAKRYFGEPVEPGSSFVVNNVGTISWNHLWPQNIRSTAIYTFGQVEQGNAGRTDTYQGLSVRVSYGIRRWLRTGAEYRHDTRDTTVTSSEYRRNLTFITLEAAL